MELGKEEDNAASYQSMMAAMEPSFWSWEKSRPTESSSQSVQSPQWSPAFGAGKRDRRVAAIPQQPSRNGAQLLELGKGSTSARVRIGELRRNGAQLLELGKGHPPCCRCPRWPAAMEPSFWSWEKRRFDPWLISKICAAMEPSFWSWEKSSRFFHQLTTSVAHLCEQRKFWGRRVGLLLPDRLGKLALTRARALPRGTEGAGALARRSAGLGWVAPRGLQRI